MDEQWVTEIPSSLKQLARLVVRGFYNIEDALIVDMLVRNPCMKEDDICELLKFERKMLRAKITTLRNDKFIQVRLKMETGLDGKAQKVNYYFINYKSFVNVVKYKLDLMRKRMETEERDATSRASFKCTNCLKTFTDLEADQLYDFLTEEFLCTHCKQPVEEDQSALPKKDSRLLLAKFNEQLEPLFVLLRQVEGIKLAPELLEPEPVDISTIRGLDKKSSLRPVGEQWSGDLTRNLGFKAEDTRVDVTIGEDTTVDSLVKKERPIWMSQSTIVSQETMDIHPDSLVKDNNSEVATNDKVSSKNVEDIMSVLLQHEKRGNTATEKAINSVLPGQDSNSDSSDDDIKNDQSKDDVETMSSDEDDNAPTVQVAGKTVPVTLVDNTLISQMTTAEKEAYIQIYQEYYSNIYD